MRLQRLAAGPILLLLLVSPPPAEGTSSGPQPGVSGVPEGGGFPAEMTCQSCHASAPLNPDAEGRVVLRGLPDQYVPGGRYRLTFAITHPDGELQRWGFQLTAVAVESFLGAGAWAVTEPTTQVVRDPNANRSYVEHSYPGTGIGTVGGHSWTFEWVAPVQDVGPVAFYGGGVASNLDGSSMGDRVFNPTPKALEIVEGPSTGSPTAEEER